MRSYSTRISKVMSTYNNGDPMVPCGNRSCMAVKVRNSRHLVADAIFSNLKLAVKTTEFSNITEWWYQESSNQARYFLFFPLLFSFLCVFWNLKNQSLAVQLPVIGQTKHFDISKVSNQVAVIKLDIGIFLRLLNCILSDFTDGKVENLTFEINEPPEVIFHKRYWP